MYFHHNPEMVSKAAALYDPELRRQTSGVPPTRKGSNWVDLQNGEQYTKVATINGIEYWMPNDQSFSIRVKFGELEKNTGFFELGDMEYEGSDYAYVVHNGKLMCVFEVEESDRAVAN